MTRRMTRLMLWVLAGAALPMAAAAQDGRYAIRGGTVHTLAGPTLEGATILLEGGRITAVGTDVTIPDGTEVIDATGRHVYPGLFNAFSQLGLQEINAVAVTNDVMELGTFNPQLVAATAVHPASERIPVTRANGVTHVLSAPSARPGGIGGQASVINLDGWTVEEMLIEPSVGMVLNWPSIQTRRFNFQTFSVDNRPFGKAKQEAEEAVERLREELNAARRYRQAVSNGHEPRDLRLEALARVVAGELPVFILADEARDIRDAVAFATDEGLTMILVGGRDAGQETALLAEHDIPVLLRATQNMPAHRDDSYHAAFDIAVRLREAGVRFAMTGWASAGPNPPSRTLAYEAANAVKFGLPDEVALMAITRYPAEILGLDGDLGTIAVGKIGNLIVTDGDPLEIRTHIERVFINGHPVSTDNKHRRLYERYRARR